MVDMEHRRTLYSCNALNVIKLHFGTDSDTILDPSQPDYKPNMIYQIFGTSEAIFGYKGLQIDLYFYLTTGKLLINIEYEDAIAVDARRGLRPDNLEELLKPWFPMGYTLSKEEFLKHTLPEDHKAFGRTLTRFTNHNSDGETTNFLINLCNIMEPGFADYHKSFEPILIFYIEGANFIDLEDDRWTVLYMYEEKLINGRFTYSLSGFVTIYNFNRTPYNNRSRISQMLMLPPYQKLGLGTKFLNTVYTVLFRELPNVQEITVESPNEHFSKLRDTLDCKLAIELDSWTPDNVKTGLTKEMLSEARSRAKIGKKQANVVYNILRMVYTDLNSPSDVNQTQFIIENRFEAELQMAHRNALSKGSNPERVETLKLLLDDTVLRKDYLDRKYARFCRKTRPIVERLKHYPYVQPRRPIQLLLQKY